MMLLTQVGWGQGSLSNPTFTENFGTLANSTALTTSNTSFSYIRVGTSSSGTPPNRIIAKDPSSFTGSSALIGAKGGSVSTVDKTGLSSFTSGTLTFKLKTPSSLTSAVLVSAVGTGASFGSSSGFTGVQLSAGFQINGTNLQVRDNGSWTTAKVVSTSTSYTVTLIFNNTVGSLNYGSGNTLASNKCHLWVDGVFVDEYTAATANLAASAFRIYTNTSEFEVDDIAVYNTLPVSPTLPVSLLSFSGYKDGIRNQLRWVTSSEINNRGFQVERSSDGQSYQSIGFVNSLAIGGNSQTPLKYSFSDAQPTGVKQYYRLKQTDIDGRNTLSNILLIQGEKPTAFEIASVFPNPTRGQITMLLSAPTNETVNIRVMDLAGRILETRQVNVLTGNNSIPFDLSKQAKGQYLIQVGEKTVRVVSE